MVFIHDMLGTHAGERFSRYMLKEKILEIQFKIMMQLQFITSEVRNGLDW